MNLNFFKSLLKFNKEKDEKSLKVAQIEKQVDILIENQNYDLLVAFVENGYELNLKQTKRFFLSFLVIGEERVNVRQGFNAEQWAITLKKITQHDKNLANTSINYMSNILKNEDFIQKICPNVYTNVLKSWTIPNTVSELNWCHAFFNQFKDEIIQCNDVEDFDKIKKNLQAVRISRREKDEESYYELLSSLTNKVIDILNDKMTHLHEATLEDVKSIYGNKKLVMPSIEKNEIIQSIQNTNDLPNQSKKLLHEIFHLINSMNKNVLDETQLLEFDNLVNEKLPQMIKNYLDVDISLREKMLSGESANSILEDNLNKFKHLFNKMKSTQNEIELTQKLNNLKINNQYLKAKV